MHQELKDMDSIYQNVISSLPLKERVTYCEQLIDKAQLSLLRNKKFLTSIIQNQLANIIEAAQKEIKQIEKIKS